MMLHFCRARLAEDISSDDPTSGDDTTTDHHGPRFSAANFAKFRGAICEVSQNFAALLSPNTLHSAASRRCCIN